MIMIIKNARLILPDRVVCGSAEFDGERIVRVTEGDHSVSPGEVLDANGMYLCPGFVDIHTHGGGGVDFMDETSHDDALNFHAKNGTTSIIPTAITAPPALLRKFAQRVRAEKEKQATGIFTGARILGAHMEGPYLSQKNKGAHPQSCLLTPAHDSYDFLLENADIIKTVTLSPELPGADKMTKALTDVGIVVSGGHDDGIYPEFMPAIGAGMSHLTHLYCAMSELRFKDGRRNVGLREYALTDDSLTAEIIADNRHIPPELARLIIRAKGADRVAVVSDSLRCAGFEKDDRLYKLGSGDDAQLFRIGDGVAVTADGTKYAGSITPVRAMVKNLIDAGIGIVDTVKTGTLTPARIIGEDKEIGSIEVGKRANICILNANFELIDLILDGNIIQKGK